MYSTFTRWFRTVLVFTRPRDRNRLTVLAGIHSRLSFSDGLDRRTRQNESLRAGVTRLTSTFRSRHSNSNIREATHASLVTISHSGIIVDDCWFRKCTTRNTRNVTFTGASFFGLHERHTRFGGRRLTVRQPLGKLPVGHGFKTSRLLPRARSAVFGRSRRSSAGHRRRRYSRALIHSQLVCTRRKGTVSLRALFLRSLPVFVGSFHGFARRCAKQMLRKRLDRFIRSSVDEKPREEVFFGLRVADGYTGVR